MPQTCSRAKHYNQTQGINIDHRNSAIRRQSVTEGSDRGESRGGAAGGSEVPAKEGMVAVTEQLDEDRRGGQRGSQLARNSQQTGHSRCVSDDEEDCETVKLLTEAFPSRVQAIRP